MNILNLVLNGLIFISLVVIIVIFGRSLKRVKSSTPSSVSESAAKPLKRNFFVRIFASIGNFFTRIFVFFAEWVVKKFKKILHLVHFWLIKLRKGKKEDSLALDQEAKKELISEEEKSLDTVINEDLGGPDDEGQQNEEIETRISVIRKRFQRKSKPQDVEQDVKKEKQGPQEQRGEQEEKREKERKIVDFFSSGKAKTEEEKLETPNKEAQEQEQEIFEKKEQQIEEVKNQIAEIVDHDEEFEQQPLEEDQEPKGKSFFASLKRKVPFFSRKKAGEDSAPFEKGAQEDELEDQFSDGVRKVIKPTRDPEEKNLIKEVVKTSRMRDEFDIDDELGVDRKILEKKILQKITSDPKNIEHYRQLGELYIKMKNFDDASDTYKFIVNASPRDADAKRKIEKIKLLKRIN